MLAYGEIEPAMSKEVVDCICSWWRSNRCCCRGRRCLSELGFRCHFL